MLEDRAGAEAVLLATPAVGRRPRLCMDVAPCTQECAECNIHTFHSWPQTPNMSEMSSMGQPGGDLGSAGYRSGYRPAAKSRCTALGGQQIGGEAVPKCE